MQTWYAQRAGQQYGPFDDATLLDLIRKGQIVEEDWLSSDAGGHWQQARAVAGLFPQVAPVAGAAGLPPLQPVMPLPARPAAAVPGQVAAIPLQAIAPGHPAAGVPVAPIPGVPGVLPGAVAAPVMPAYGVPGVAPVATATPVQSYAPAPTPRKSRIPRSDSMRWTVLLLMALLLLLFWYVWLNPVASPITGAMMPALPSMGRA